MDLFLASDGGSGIAVLLLVLVGGAIGVALYFLPALIAFNRGHHQRVAILILDFFFGWTFIGWVACLVWSATHIPVEARGTAAP